LLLKPRAHKLMPPALQSLGLRGPGELLRQVGNTLELCRMLEERPPIVEETL